MTPVASGFLLSGAVVGLIVGAGSALFPDVRFARGALLALILTLLPWGLLLLQWDLASGDEGLKGVIPFVVYVIAGALPFYAIAYGVVKICARKGRTKGTR